MLTRFTCAAIAVLYDIYNENACFCPETESLSLHNLSDLLLKLTTGGFIALLPGKPTDHPDSYRLIRSFSQISLLDILEVTDEHLNCNHEPYEMMYQQHRAAANKLGIINQITRKYLKEIKLIDL